MARNQRYPYQVNVRLTPEIYRRLVERTDELDKPISEYVREVLEDSLPQTKTKRAR